MSSLVAEASAAHNDSGAAKKETKKEEVDTTTKPGGILSTPPPAVKPGEGPGNTIIFIGAGLRYDLGSFSQREVVGRAVITDALTDRKQLAPNLNAGFLLHLAGSFRWGLNFTYGFDYELTERSIDGDREPETIELGQYLALDLRAEWSKQLGGPVWLTVTPLVGVTGVLPGGELREKMTSLEESHSLWTGPQLGFLAGGELGARYQYNDYLSFRGAAGLAYTLQSLLNAGRTGSAADSERKWSSNATRISTTLAAEASF